MLLVINDRIIFVFKKLILKSVKHQSGPSPWREVGSSIFFRSGSHCANSEQSRLRWYSCVAMLWQSSARTGERVCAHDDVSALLGGCLFLLYLIARWRPKLSVGRGVLKQLGRFLACAWLKNREYHWRLLAAVCRLCLNMWKLSVCTLSNWIRFVTVEKILMSAPVGFLCYKTADFPDEKQLALIIW